MPANPDLQRPVVLVVDDAPSSLGMLCDSLEGEGYTVLVARDGDAALQRLELVAPDAILLDAVMPGLSGFDTCRRIKANPALAHIPVIFMTGLSETPHVLEGFACGGVDYVVKPLRAGSRGAPAHPHPQRPHDPAGPRGCGRGRIRCGAGGCQGTCRMALTAGRPVASNARRFGGSW